jgi:hypothetical protein
VHGAPMVLGNGLPCNKILELETVGP